MLQTANRPFKTLRHLRLYFSGMATISSHFAVKQNAPKRYTQWSPTQLWRRCGRCERNRRQSAGFCSTDRAKLQTHACRLLSSARRRCLPVACRDVIDRLLLAAESETVADKTHTCDATPRDGFVASTWCGVNGSLCV